jgi:hypothetical protein
MLGSGERNGQTEEIWKKREKGGKEIKVCKGYRKGK